MKKCDWMWNARIVYWPGCLEGLNLDITVPEARSIAEELHRAGANVVMINHRQKHFRFDFISIFPEIERAVGIVADACHEYGLKLIEHHSSTVVTTKGGIGGSYNGRNIDDWANVDIRTGDVSGIKLNHDGGTYESRWCCINNPGWKAAYYDYISAFLENTGVDGLMHDDVHFAPGWFRCGCRYCRDKFKAMMGYDLPEGLNHPAWENFEHPVWRDWIRFRLVSTGDEFVDISKVIGPDKALFGCCSIGANFTLAAHDAGYTYEAFARGANVLYQESCMPTRNESPGWRYHFYNWRRHFLDRKYYQALSQARQAPAIAFYYPASAGEEFFCWALTKTFGHGYIVYPGHSYAESVNATDYFAWEESRASLYRQPEDDAAIGIAYSEATMALLGDDSRYYIDEWRGWCETLIDAHIPFRVVLTDTDFDMDCLKGLKLLILPNTACLSDTQLQVIRQFVEKGGNLIITHEASLHDETGQPRGDFALADVLGFNFKRTVTRINLPFYTESRHEGGELLKTLAGRIPYFGPQVFCRLDKSRYDRVFAWIEKYNQYSQEPPYPAVIEGDYKHGRYLYFSFKPGLMAAVEGPYVCGVKDYAGEEFIAQDVTKSSRKFWVDDSLSAYKDLILNAVAYLSEASVSIKAPAGIAVNHYRLKDGSTVLNILNTAGTGLKHGDDLPAAGTVNYPAWEDGYIEINLPVQALESVHAVSPDISGQVNLAFERTEAGCEIKVPLALLKRFLTVHAV